MATKWNPTGIAVIGLGLVIGWAFGGQIGLGVAAVILTIVQLF